MSTQNIIELAKQAGIPTLLFPDGVEQLSAAHERFAALVRAAALEEAAVVCETNADRWPGTSKVYAAMECAAAIRALKGTPNVLE